MKKDKVAFAGMIGFAIAIGFLGCKYTIICWWAEKNLKIPMHYSYGYIQLAGGATLLAVLAEGYLAVEHLRWGAAAETQESANAVNGG